MMITNGIAKIVIHNAPGIAKYPRGCRTFKVAFACQSGIIRSMLVVALARATFASGRVWEERVRASVLMLEDFAMMPLV